ncbi:hypothetical protein AMJ71_09320, partial [candidate division TA06 bacterium SM1_40]
MHAGQLGPVGHTVSELLEQRRGIGTEDNISTEPDKPTFFEYYNKANSYGPSDSMTFYVGGKAWKDTIACSVDPECGRSYGGNVVIYPPYSDPSFP